MGASETVVLDTNVLVSALGWRGNEREIYVRCREGRLRLAASPALIAELRRVLHYPRLGFTEDEIEGFISDLLGHASTVEPSPRERCGLSPATVTCWTSKSTKASRF